MFDVGPVYEANDNATADIIINQGGTDSGKTYAIMQLLLKFCYKYKYSYDNPEMICTVVGMSVPNLKKGPWRIAKTICSRSADLTRVIASWNLTERNIIFKNGAIIEFVSYETEDDAKQGKRQYSFFNECNLISWNIFWQVAKRTRIRTFVDYNPSSKFFVHHKLIGKSPDENELSATVQLIISDHRHNPFLTDDQHARTENIKDPKKWLVYARGKTGELEGMIFHMARVPEIPKGLPFGFGIDFGYNVDKTSLVKVYWQGNKRYYHELLYEVGVDTDKIAKVLKQNGCDTSTMVWGDHDKVASVYLRRLGIPFRMAKKGPNSVIASISKVNEYENYYYDSPNLEKELEVYLYDKGIDLLTGNEVFLNVPVDGFDDHSIAAIRYFIYSHSMRFVS